MNMIFLIQFFFLYIKPYFSDHLDCGDEYRHTQKARKISKSKMHGFQSHLLPAELMNSSKFAHSLYPFTLRITVSNFAYSNKFFSQNWKIYSDFWFASCCCCRNAKVKFIFTKINEKQLQAQREEDKNITYWNCNKITIFSRIKKMPSYLYKIFRLEDGSCLVYKT